MQMSEDLKDDLVFYICGRLPLEKLDTSYQNWVESNPDVLQLRNDVIKKVNDLGFHAGKGNVDQMLTVLGDIDNLLSQLNLQFPENLEDFYIKVGVLNGIPMQYKLLRDAMRINNSQGIQQHWKLFSNFIYTI